MSFWTLVIRSLRFHARAHLGVLLGALVGSAALVGALVVGDSVRGSLRDFALSRIGNVDLALIGGDRFFRDHLSDELTSDAIASAPVLQLPGTITSAEGSARGNHIQVIGIDSRIGRVQSTAPLFTDATASEVVLNEALALHLKAAIGDTVLLRIQKPSALSREAPISPQQDFSLALRLVVKGIATDAQFGRFDLNASQLPARNAFVPLELLQQKLDLTNRANLLLVRGPTGPAQIALRKHWRPADAELEIAATVGQTEVRSRRVFIDPPTAQVLAPNTSDTTGILTYFVNELRDGGKATPYSMVTGAGVPLIPAEMRDDEILVNQWLADDLQAKPGDSIQLKYFVMGTSSRLEEKTNSFRVRSLVPMQGAYADRTLMPDFPGLAKAESTENWDAGFPIQMSKIRPKDEKYWKDFRGTPKAFVTLAAAQSMWSNRFGALTAIRFANSGAARRTNAIDPAMLGLTFQPVREQALKASSEAQDFGELFLGFSFFLILAGLILMGLLVQLELEHRTAEVGTLLAVGYRPAEVRRLFLTEAALIALAGGVIGALAGMAYARLMLLGLTTIWSKAVAGAGLHYHAQPQTLAVGIFAAFVVALITIFLVLRKQARRPARELLSERGGVGSLQIGASSRKTAWLAIGCLVGAVGLVLAMLSRGDTANAGAFFGAGSLMLICGIAAAAVLLGKLGHSQAASQLTLTGMGIRGGTRRRKRSVATVALLACGCFIIVAVGANRLDATRDAFKRSSGTGGFALIGESSLPVFQDLNSSAGREFFALNNDELKDVSIVPMRLREGDDASCLNLNRAQRPRVLGVNPQLLVARQAFTFDKAAPQHDVARGWLLLEQTETDGSVPAIADANSIEWALHKNLGDTLDYLDEQGRPFKIKLVGAIANSILQGNLIIADKHFVQRFPGISGYRMFLMDGPSNTVAQTAAALTRGLQDAGLELTPAVERLDGFNAVQNTYLNTFQVLGGLGLLVGTAGLGVVVLRNVLERRGELALLRAVGFRRRSLRWLVLSEHAALLLLGLAVGLVAAIVAVVPSFFSPEAHLPVLTLSATIGSVFVVGLVFTAVSVAVALRGELLDALRNE